MSRKIGIADGIASGVLTFSCDSLGLLFYLVSFVSLNANKKAGSSPAFVVVVWFVCLMVASPILALCWNISRGYCATNKEMRTIPPQILLHCYIFFPFRRMTNDHIFQQPIQWRRRLCLLPFQSILLLPVELSYLALASSFGCVVIVRLFLTIK